MGGWAGAEQHARLDFPGDPGGSIGETLKPGGLILFHVRVDTAAIGLRAQGGGIMWSVEMERRAEIMRRMRGKAGIRFRSLLEIMKFPSVGRK